MSYLYTLLFTRLPNIIQILFATTASFLTLTYAPYAKQSGIPEIKTVLGGFVIRRFMGAWTLIIKSIGLVRFSILIHRPKGS